MGKKKGEYSHFFLTLLHFPVPGHWEPAYVAWMGLSSIFCS